MNSTDTPTERLQKWIGGYIEVVFWSPEDSGEVHIVGKLILADEDKILLRSIWHPRDDTFGTFCERFVTRDSIRRVEFLDTCAELRVLR